MNVNLRAIDRPLINFRPDAREKRHEAWRVVCYSAAATAITWSVLTVLKLQGALPPHMTWAKVFLLPAIGFAVWPALLFWAAWQSRARPAPRGCPVIPMNGADGADRAP